MPARLLISKAAGGRTEYAMRLAMETVTRQEAEVRVCVATALQARAWRERVAAAGGALGIHVFNFSRLVEVCLADAGESYNELGELFQFRLLRTVISELPLELYAPIRRKAGFIQIVQQRIAELKAGLIDEKAFSQAVAELGEEPRLRELATIYEAYQQQLRAHGWADRAGLHWLAVEALEHRARDACKNWPLLVVDGFDDFNYSQIKLLRVLAGRVGELLITLPRSPAIEFPRYHETRKLVESNIGVEAAPLPFETRNCHPILSHLADHLFAENTAEPLVADRAVLLREAPDRAFEVRTALRWLKQRILADDLPPGQTALLAREITPYRAYIQQIAAEFGMPIQLVSGLPLAQSPVINAVLELLRLYLPLPGGRGYSLPRARVIEAWRSPYFRWKRDKETIITPSDAEALDALAREQRVLQGRDQWEEAFAAAQVDTYSALDDLEEETGPRALTTWVVEHLKDQFGFFLERSAPPASALLEEYADWLESLIGPEAEPGDPSPPDSSLFVVEQAQLNKATAGADIAALRELNNILRGLVLAEAMMGQPEPITFSTFMEELGGAILASSFVLPAQGSLAEIVVASAGEARGLSFSAVAVLGLGEGSFPAIVSEDPFLRDGDRERLRQHAGFPLRPSTLSTEQEQFYEAISRARDGLLLTRPLLAENGAEWVASPYWEAVQQLVSTRIERISSERAPSPAESASEAEWWEAIAACGENGAVSGAWQLAAGEQITAAARIWHERQKGAVSSWDGDLRQLSDRLAVQFGPQAMWSASRLETYQQCAFLFFLRYVLALEPRPEPAEGLDARQLGTLYHAVFERVSKAQHLASKDLKQVREHVATVAKPILDRAPQQLGFRATAWWPQTREEIISNVAQSLYELTGDGTVVLYTELPFGGESPPLALRDGADRLLLRGFIDRIDRGADGQIRIVDYKLGSKYKFTPDAFAEGKKLQLPLYALAAQEVLGLGPISDGFYWHYQQAETSSFHLAGAPGGVAGAIDTAVAFAWEVAQHARRGQFSPRPPDDGCPTYCPAAGFCWQYKPRDW